MKHLMRVFLISRINVLYFFFFLEKKEIWAGFCSVSLFSQLGVFCAYVFCWNNEYIFDNISRIWVQKVLEKG